MKHNLEIAQLAIASAVEHLDENKTCSCHTALDNAVMSDSAAIPQAALERLKPIVGRLYQD